MHKAFIIVPQGLDGPAFLVTQNFNAVMAYNESHSYAVAVGHLADRIRRQGPDYGGSWPEQTIELSFAERVEMQKRLIRHGFSDGRHGRPLRCAGPMRRSWPSRRSRRLGA